MENGEVGYVFDIQRYTLNDGPGIRTEVFLQGCPLRCLWCHSPESQSYTGELAWLPLHCVGIEKCGECLKVCPVPALKVDEPAYSKYHKEEIKLPRLDRTLCPKCGACTKVCSPKALYFTAQKMTVAEIMEIIEKDRDYYRRSQGGVTISGGEAMVQYPFTLAIFKACKEQGLHTALDTAGYVPWENYEAVLNYVDLVLYDIKCMNPEKSQRLTGKENQLILSNAVKIAQKGVEIQIRIPIIPGLNDDQDNLTSSAKFCARLGPAVKRVQLLPYHKLGISKYNRIGKPYSLTTLEPPANYQMEQYKNLFESHGLQVQIG